MQLGSTTYYISCNLDFMLDHISTINYMELQICVIVVPEYICRATTWPPRPSSTAECLRLIAHLREEQASAASWEPRPPFEAAEMD